MNGRAHGQLTAQLPGSKIVIADPSSLYAERRYGGALDDEMRIACPPKDLVSAIDGMKALAKNGFRYPIPQYGVQQDVRAGMVASDSDEG